MNPLSENPDMIKQMSSVVSHELRNPLAIIANSIYFIKTKLGVGGAALDPKVAKHIGVIEGEVKRSNEIIEEMLAFTRKRDVQLVPLALDAIVGEQVAAYALPQGVTINVNPDPSNPHVNVDKDTVCYALRCVFSNAVQAMPEGGVITLTTTHDDAVASLTVADTGPGLPEGGAKVFEPFFTTRPRGLGLGLPIVRKFMEALGGTAKAENISGGGAKITLTLPLCK